MLQFNAEHKCIKFERYEQSIIIIIAKWLTLLFVIPKSEFSKLYTQVYYNLVTVQNPLFATFDYIYTRYILISAAGTEFILWLSLYTPTGSIQVSSVYSSVRTSALTLLH